MSLEVNFSVDVDGLSVSGRLRRPAGDANGRVPPAVLLCRAVLEPSDAEENLVAAIEHGLIAAGVAVAMFDPRIRRGELEDGTPAPMPNPIDCAAAVFEWLTKRIDIDGLRLSVLGHGIGAIVAAGLAIRVPQVHRICLISPAAPEWLAGQVTQRNGTLDAAAQRFRALLDVPVAQAILGNRRQTLIILGAAERAQRSDGGRVFEQAAAAAPRHIEVILVPFADATFSSPTVRQVCIERITEFFSQQAPAEAKA